MTPTVGTPSPRHNTATRSLATIDGVFTRLPAFVPLLALRLALAVPFFKSGLTKWDGFQVSAGARYLFAEEFKLHLSTVSSVRVDAYAGAYAAAKHLTDLGHRR